MPENGVFFTPFLDPQGGVSGPIDHFQVSSPREAPRVRRPRCCGVPGEVQRCPRARCTQAKQCGKDTHPMRHPVDGTAAPIPGSLYTVLAKKPLNLAKTSNFG